MLYQKLPCHRRTIVFATRLLPCRQYVVGNQRRPPLLEVCQVDSVVMQTMQLVLNQLKNFLIEN